MPVSGAASIAQMCTWIFDAYDTDYDRPRRVVVGGDKERTLGEALQKAGYEYVSAKSNEVDLCAVGMPLILLPYQDLSQVINPDVNIGFTYQARYSEPEHRSPVPLLRKRSAKLIKKQGGVKLSLWWYEPKTEDDEETE